MTASYDPLVEALAKYVEWNNEMRDIEEHMNQGDTAGRLMEVLEIPSHDVRCLIGGSNAPIFHRAAEEIEQLREFKKAYIVWQNKTEWVHDRKEWGFPALGMHRADVMKTEIQRLGGATE